MLKALNSIKYTIKSLYLHLVLWLDKFREEEYRTPTSIPAITISATQTAYEEGLKRIKSRVSEQGNKEAVEKFLSDNQDKLLSLAENEANREEIELLKKAFIYKQKDIKSSTDLERMIDRRIRDFKELHKHKLQREKLRQLRKQNGRPRDN